MNISDIENRECIPQTGEMIRFADSPLLNRLFSIMENEYHALIKTEYSGDKILLGWNIKFKKGGRTLCTVYPRDSHFFLLLVVGRKEKERVEALLPSLSEKFRSVYRDTREGMGQRWLLFDFSSDTEAFDDVLKVIRIRRENR